MQKRIYAGAGLNRTALWSVVSGFLFALGSHAQVPRDFAVDLRAAVSATAPHITLSWTQRQQGKISAQTLFRRLKTSTGTAWEPLPALATTDTSYADASALPGVEYEYWMRRTFSGLSPSPAAGYLSAGVGVPFAEFRGTLLLVVDDTMAAPLAPEIAQLRDDLAGDGWTVQTLTAPRSGTAAGVKAQIKAAYDAAPASVNTVYLLGHVPVPYSGDINPDGHSDHRGAWPADGYYGDMDGVWADTSVSNTVASRNQNDNVPGDGKFDQNSLPSAVELMVGRVDLHSMTKAPSTAATETQLLRRYLRKAHDYRHKQGAYAAIPRRSILRDGFGYFSGETFAIAGWSWMFSSVGLTIDEPPSDQWFSASYAGGKDYLVGYGNGSGSYESAGTVGTSADFGFNPSRVVFTSLFGSYFGDWDTDNNLMRAVLAGNATGDSLGLTCFWGGRPNRFMHHLGMGETAGFAMRVSHNANFWDTNVQYLPNSYAGVHCGLLGDPALRLHAVAPPRNLAGTSANSQVVLAWTAPDETAVQGYHIYRAATPAGPFARLTEDPLTATSFTDPAVAAGQSYTYRVRTLKLETAPGGTYFNLSVGAPLTLTAHASANAAPRNPASPAVSQTSGASAQLTWTDTSSNETGFRIERKTNAAGAFTALSTAAANATSFTDAGPFAHGNVYAYRIIAASAAGDSAPSAETSFEAVAGHFNLPTTRTKINKTAGSVTLTVNRFGGLTGAAAINYATSDSSAAAGTHYTAASGALNWADGATGAKTLSIPILNTAAPQPARQLKLTLSGNSSGTGLTLNNTARILIEDPTASLAAPWSQTIVGSVTDASSAVLIDGVFGSTLIGGSGVTSDTSDNGRFIYQSRSGDGILPAYVPAGIPADTGARVGLLVRASTANNAVAAAAVASANSSVGAKLGYRASAGGSAAALPASANALLLPCWLRLTRAGSLFTAEASKDGAAWTALGTATLAGMPASALWGLFHYASNGSDYHLAAAQNVAFDALPPISAPANLTATATSPSSITLDWTSVPGASGYRIERLTETSDFALLADSAAMTGASQTYIDAGLDPDTAFAYRVTAYSTSGDSAASETVYATTLPPHITLTFTTADAGGADATLQRNLPSTPLGTAPVVTVAGYYYNSSSSWGVLPDASKTYLRFNIGGSTAPISARLKLSFADARLFESNGYFNIYASLLSEASDLWDENSITWNNAPQNDTASYGFTGTTLFLGNLYEERLPTADETLMIDLDETTLFGNRGANGLVTLALHQYYGASTDWAAHEHASAPPPTLEFSCVNAAPLRPSFFTAAPGYRFSVRLNWRDNATDETAYELERSVDGGDFAALPSLPAGTTTFTDTDTQPNTLYAYRVRAVNAAGASAWSSAAQLATPDTFSAWGTVWDGDLNTYFSVPLNWDLDTLPPFDGSASLNFASRGAYAIINNTASVYGLSLHSTNDFTLVDGNGTLILGAGGLRAANPHSNTSHVYTVASDITLAADQTWGVTNNGAGGTTLVVSGPVKDDDAAYGITKAGDGLLIIGGANSYDGPTLVAAGTLRVRHGSALGSAAGPTAVQAGATLDVGGAVLVPESLSLAAGALLLASDGTTNTWSGPVSLAAGALLRATGTSSLTLSGGASAAGNLTLAAEPQATLALSGLPLAAASRTLTVEGGGTVVFGAPGNTWADLRIGGGSTVRAEAPNAFPPASSLSLGLSGALDATVDLNGHDQTVAQLKRGIVTSGTRLVTSAAPATLTVNYTGGSSITYDGALGGALNLVKDGSGTLILSDTHHTTTGSFTVSNGVLRLPAASVIADTATLRIASPGRLQLSAGVVETVNELVLDGGRKWKGTWGASGSGAENIDNTHFTGTGVINVPSGTSSTWDGGAATSDIDAPFNWDYDDLPALFDGSRTLAFGVGGALATVNTDVSLHGMILNRDADFTFAAGGGAITLGAGGLFASLPGGTPHTYTVGAALNLTTPQTWCVTNSGAATTTVVVSGPLSDGGAGHALVQSGSGLLSLAGDNSSFSGGITVQSNSVLRVAHARGLGDTAASTLVQSGARLEIGGGVTVAEPVTLNGDVLGAPGALYAVAGTNTWTGPITQASASRIGATAGGTLVLAAPVLTGDVTLSPDAGACVLIAGQPLLLGSRKLIAHGAGTVAIGIAGCTFNATLEIGGSATVRLDVPNALPASTILSMGRSGALDATVDLNGHDQTVVQLKRGIVTAGTRLVTSAAPATLTVNYTGGSSITYDGGFGGALNLVKTGSGTLIVTGTNTTMSGTVAVNGGTLRLNTDVTLGSSPRVIVNGGTLYLRHGACIADDAELAVAVSGAKLQLDPGVTETVRTLRIGGVLMRRGTYGAAGSGADFIDSTRFSGTGILHVLRGTESVLTIR